jgi:hypothetical protein
MTLIKNTTQRHLGKKYLTHLKKTLWWVSLIGTLVFLINMRIRYEVRHQVDRYFDAIQHNDEKEATRILDSGSFDQINLVYGVPYFYQRMQEPMSPATLQCGFESLEVSRRVWFLPREDLLRLFRQKGARPTEKTLFFALRCDDIGLALECLKAGVKGESILGETPPLLTVCRLLDNTKEGSECFGILLKNKVNLNKTNEEGGTALHICMQYHGNNANKEITELLKHGANPNMKNGIGKVPLDLAVETQNIDVVKLLLDFKADPNHVWYEEYWYSNGGKKKVSLLTYAKEEAKLYYKDDSTLERYQRRKIIELLERYGAKEKL